MSDFRRHAFPHLRCPQQNPGRRRKPQPLHQVLHCTISECAADPTRLATSKRDTRVVATLLECGAGPVPHVSTWPFYKPTYSVLRVALSKQEGIAVPRFFGLIADRRRSRARLRSRVWALERQAGERAIPCWRLSGVSSVKFGDNSLIVAGGDRHNSVASTRVRGRIWVPIYFIPP
jgi:hypothetical protein